MAPYKCFQFHSILIFLHIFLEKKRQKKWQKCQEKLQKRGRKTHTNTSKGAGKNVEKSDRWKSNKSDLKDVQNDEKKIKFWPRKRISCMVKEDNTRVEVKSEENHSVVILTRLVWSTNVQRRKEMPIGSPYFVIWIIFHRTMLSVTLYVCLRILTNIQTVTRPFRRTSLLAQLNAVKWLVLSND